MGVLDAPVLLLVVEDQLGAHGADRLAKRSVIWSVWARSAASSPVGKPSGASRARERTAFGPMRLPGVSRTRPLVQSNDPQIRFEPVGAMPVLWNNDEALDPPRS
ncbi:hypothetical protein C0Q63_11715 [Streptomyces albidoflavus]|nr:hypothetical protein C0Q63_11715 [Streptomyces albidoflavus]